MGDEVRVSQSLHCVHWERYALLSSDDSVGFATDDEVDTRVERRANRHVFVYDIAIGDLEFRCLVGDFVVVDARN